MNDKSIPNNSLQGQIRFGLKLIIFSFMIFSIGQSSARGATIPLVVESGEHRYFLDRELSYLKDDKNILKIADVVQGKHDDAFIPANTTTLSFGFTKATIWLKFTINNPHDYSLPLFIEINAALLEDIRFFYLDPSANFKEYLTGTNYAYHTRPVNNEDFVFEVEQAAQSTTTYYFRVRSTMSMLIPLAVSTNQGFARYIDIQHLIMGGYWGLTFAMIFYNLFLYISVKDRAYLYYVFFIFFSSLCEASFSGITYQLWPESIVWNKQFLFLAVSLAAIMHIQFSRNFLQTEKKFLKMDFILKLFIVINAGSFLAVVWIGKIGALFSIAFGSLTSTIILVIAIMAFRKGYRPARYLILGGLIFSAGSFLTGLMGFGTIPSTDFSRAFFMIGSSLEAILLSLALGDRINLLIKEKFESVSAAKEAKLESKMKSEFLAKMSHEIRTPMNGVLGMAELLKDTSLTTTQSHYTNIIYNSGKVLLNVINDILDYSKIEAGKMTLESIPFNLDALINECLAVFTLTAQQKNITIIVNVKPDVPLYLIGDPLRLRQILLNLLSNAFKFTEQGDIVLTVVLLEDRNNEAFIHFSLKDSGIGISKEGQQKLFQSFSQADASTTRRFGGAGLGLIIAKQLVEMMRGEIGVASEEGKGATFWFTAHFVKDDLKHQAVMVPQAFSLNGYRVLVIDDNELFCEIVKEQATAWGMQVLVANRADVGYQLLKEAAADQKKVDVILLDLNLPDQNGLELAHFLQQDILLRTIPIILVTALRQLPDKLKMHENGIVLSLEKPITGATLFKAFTQVFGMYQPQEKLSIADTVDVKELGDIRNQHLLVAEDNQVNQMVIQGLLKKLGVTNITLANDGMEAVELFALNPEKFTMILMDCEMPNLDGYGASSQIRNIEAKQNLKRIPIIALTAHAIAEYREKSFLSGMDDHLNKPIILQELKELLLKFNNGWMHK